VVSYTNEVKRRVLGVSQEMLDQFGAVSPEVARAMAEGALRVLGCDIAVAATGVAGPDPDDRGNPVGLVYVSLAASDGVWVRTLKLGSDRERVRTAASSYALDMVRRYLTGLPVA